MRTWGSEEEAWLRGSYPRGTIEETCAAFRERFGREVSRQAMYAKANKMGLHKENREDWRPAERTVRWSQEPEMSAWMLAHDHGQRIDDLASEFEARWGFRLNRSQVSLFRSSHGTQSRRSYGGGRPSVPVGSERDTGKGYVIVKVAEHPGVAQSKDNWRPKHWVAWERANGRPVPDGCEVMAADRDRTNCDPDNLLIVDKAVVGIINGQHLDYWDMESLRAAVALARLIMARTDLENAPRRCQRCGRWFTPRNRSAHSMTCPECVDAGHKASGWDRRRDAKAGA